MSLAAKIREQLISSFRVELAEHIQTMTDGLLALEQSRVAREQRPESSDYAQDALVEGQRQSTLEDVFRAAHSLKGAARAVGVTAIEQLAHALEDLLDAMRQDAIELTPELFTACYRALDAIQAVQVAYESGETTPPVQALQALADLESFRPSAPQPFDKLGTRQARDSAGSGPGPRPLVAQRAGEGDAPSVAATPSPEPVACPEYDRREGPASGEPMAAAPTDGPEAALADASQPPTPTPPPSSGGDETIRVSVSKLDALMAQLSELLVTKIRAEQRLTQVRELQEFMTLWQKEWLSIRSAHGWLVRQDISSVLGLCHSETVEVLEGDAPGPSTALPSTTPSTGLRAGLGTGRTGPRRPDGSTGSPQRLIEGTKGGNCHSKLGKEMLRLLDYVGTSQERLRQMNGLINNLSRQYADDTLHMSLVIDELEQEIKRVRMLPLNTITGPFGRMVRDLAQEMGKEAVLQIIGGDTELDKRVLEQIKDPLIHMLRNAIDHGIEPPEQRVALGKPRSGTVTLAAEQLGKDVVICVSDDGAGLNIDAIRQTVARYGVTDAQMLSETELAEIIFKVGISTSPIITDISGRGVGLDVVRRNVEALHGRIDVDWTPGAGTTFTLTLPLRLTSSHGLLVRVSNELFAIPLNAIERIMYVSLQDISPLEGHDTIRYNGYPLTLVRLDDVLELPHADVQRDSVLSPPTALRTGLSKGEAHILVVILAAAERRIAFAVDELAGEQEVVIKGLGKQLMRVGGIAGATVMGSGQVVLILNVADLIKLAMRGKRRSVFDTPAETVPSAVARAQRHILIVDDSITTRTLEKNILEAAGYTVQLATDGQEALSAVATGSVMPDLIISDIVMPRMDGFELTRRIKNGPNTADVPVILVTSLGSPKDKARGIEAGADAYIVKSGFDQGNLLEAIEQLI